ncbi:TPA: GIY-YIG nuclease family protein [Salmonella enterica subsp. enterica serovar Mbandaka]
MAMDDRRAGRAFLYVLGDPCSRFSASKIGITQRLENRLLHIYSNTRRHTHLPDGMAVFSLYSLPNWQQAAELERALLRTFRTHKTDARTLGWLALKPGMIDLAIDVTAERLGVDCQQSDFSYVRWSHDDTENGQAFYQ